MEEYPKRLIEASMASGDWSKSKDILTFRDLTEWIEEQKGPDILADMIKPIKCPVCGISKNRNKVTLSHRYAHYLARASFLSKRAIEDDGFVHHSRTHDMLKMQTGIDLTSYSYLTRYPWDFLEPRKPTDYKVNRDGHFRLTDRGRDFMNRKLAVPETIYIYNKEVVGVSNKLVFCNELSKFNFHELVEQMKSW